MNAVEELSKISEAAAQLRARIQDKALREPVDALRETCRQVGRAWSGLDGDGWAKVYRCLAKRREAVRSEACIGIPEIIAGKIDVLPAAGREVGEERVRDYLAAAAQDIERPADLWRDPT
jgi:hypothetical protein